MLGARKLSKIYSRLLFFVVPNYFFFCWNWCLHDILLTSEVTSTSYQNCLLILLR